MRSGAAEKLQGELRVGFAARPVVEVLASLLTVVDELDPGSLAPRDALDVVKVLDRLGRVADAGKMAAASQVAVSNLWKGHRSPAQWLANVTGVGHGDAIRMMKTAETVANAPETWTALSKGEVSPRQANAIAKVEQVSSEQGRALLAKAPRMATGELETEAKRIVAAETGETAEQKAMRIRKNRNVIHGDDGDGTGWGRWELPMADHVRFLSQLQGLQDQFFAHARVAGVEEPAAAYAADALCRLGDLAVAGGEGQGAKRDWSPAKVIVRVDLTALDRGHVEPGEMCEVAGAGPIPVADAWRMIDGDAFVAAIATRGVEIDKVVHLGRKPTVLQRTALEWRSAGECGIEGCTSRARLEIDHVSDWATTRRTELSQLSRPCGRHHDLKTHHGYTFGPVGPDGKRQLIPPNGASTDAPEVGPDPPSEESSEPTTISNAPTARARTRPETDPATDADGPSQGDLFDTG